MGDFMPLQRSLRLSDLPTSHAKSRYNERGREYAAIYFLTDRRYLISLLREIQRFGRPLALRVAYSAVIWRYFIIGALRDTSRRVCL